MVVRSRTGRQEIRVYPVATASLEGIGGAIVEA
jgi:hypothetical protein